MLTQEPTIPICPECGTRLEGGFSRNLGRCMICLLRVGFDDVEEPNEAPLSSVADRLGNYRIDRHDDGTPWELGRGAMGITYRAVDTSLQRPVALKLIDSEWVKRGAEARERFMREARAAAALRHPNVATVYHFGIREENGQCFCAMELVEGETLEMRVRRTGPLDALTTIDIALQVSSALATAEKQGLVHRDLKPANLMVVEAEPPPLSSSNDNATRSSHSSRKNATRASHLLVKVIDFGVAKALVEKPDAMGLTHGGFVGTPAFASPEQFTDARVDVRSDIYSLGATLWYLLTGHRPFQGATIEQIRTSQHSHALPIEQLKAARAPARLITLLASMLAAEPAARPGVRALTSKLQECRDQFLDRWKAPRRLALAAAVFALASAVAFPVFRRSQEQALPANVPAKSIAVLPFENLNADQGNPHFAEGIQDQILTKLASVADLKVISRISTEKYGSKPRDLRSVSKELGVATVLQGTVQKDGERVRVNVELIDARSDRRIWTKNYDSDLRDVFAIQSEISQEIGNALRAKLSASEAVVLAAAATRDPEAYDLFLRGEYEQRRGESLTTAEPLDRAADFYRRALSLDPSFALAAARLARNRLWWHWVITPLTSVELEEVKTLVDGALAIAPDLAESHVSLALFHYMGHREYEQALPAFQRALELQPNHADARKFSGYVYRRMGQWERSLVEMARAEELDPRDDTIPANIAASYVNLRQWNDAKRAASRSLTLHPHNQVGLRNLFLSCVNGDGRTDAARRVIGSLPSGVTLTTNAVRGSVSNIIEDFSYLQVLERDFAGALQHAKNENDDPRERVSRLVARVAIRVLAGDAAGEKAESEEACALMEARLRERPDDGFAMTQLSWVYLALGRKADALRMAHQAAEWLPIEKDAFGGPSFAVGLAQIQARTGEASEAVKTLRHLLSIPAGIAVSLNRLKIDPVWDPVRSVPEFQQLLAGREEIGGYPGYGQLKLGDLRVDKIFGSRASK
jgi:serine/threonine protein kinase/Flp pilus assembly protein TadD